jgi:hypothetical protein
MTWNYRIIRRHGETFSKEDEYYVLTEVFYQEPGEVMAFSDKENIIASSPQEIIEILEMMLADVKKYPELYEKDFE